MLYQSSHQFLVFINTSSNYIVEVYSLSLTLQRSLESFIENNCKVVQSLTFTFFVSKVLLNLFSFRILYFVT